MMLLGNPCGGPPNSQDKTKQPEGLRTKKGDGREETAGANAEVGVGVPARAEAEPEGGTAAMGPVDPGAAAQQPVVGPCNRLRRWIGVFPGGSILRPANGRGMPQIAAPLVHLAVHLR